VNRHCSKAIRLLFRAAETGLPEDRKAATDQVAVVLRQRGLSVERAYADGGYAGRLVRWAKNKTHIVLEIVKRSAEQTGFAVIRRRWVVERTFAWIMKNRRLVREDEQLTAVAETLITIAAAATLIRRWP
jgi:transposase